MYGSSMQYIIVVDTRVARSEIDILWAILEVWAAVIECVIICFGSCLNLWHNYNSLSYFWSNPHVLYVGLVFWYLVLRTGIFWYRSGNTKCWFGNVIYISGTDYTCQILWSILPVPAHISTHSSTRNWYYKWIQNEVLKVNDD